MTTPDADYGQIWHFTATAPAGTPIATPVIVPITMPVRTVDRIYWRVPNGPMGVMGWQLSMGGLQVLPTPGGDLFVVANDEHDDWTPRNLPDSGAWQVTMYNTGANPHSVYLAFHVSPVARRDVTALMAAGVGGPPGGQPMTPLVPDLIPGPQTGRLLIDPAWIEQHWADYVTQFPPGPM